MSDINDLYQRVLAVRRDPDAAKVRALEYLVEDSEGEGSAWEVLRELALDLSYYEDNEEWRREDLSYYGRERLVALLDETIRRLDALGFGPKPAGG